VQQAASEYLPLIKCYSNYYTKEDVTGGGCITYGLKGYCIHGFCAEIWRKEKTWKTYALMRV